MGRWIAMLVFTSTWNAVGAQEAATVRVRGVVTDSAGRAVSFANVLPLPKGRRIVADADGRFVLDADSTLKSIEIRRIGFEPKLIEQLVWSDSVQRIVLVPLPARLERVRVEAEQRIQSLITRGFYDRQAELEKGINHGFMITAEEIDQRKGARVTDFLLGHPAVKVARVSPISGRGRTGLQPQGLGGCRMEVYLDGQRFYTTKWPPDPRVDRDLGDQYVDDQISTSTIAAIEVYPRAVGAPPRFQTLNGGCGVILIWTR